MGKIAVVTGAGRGIGREVALRLAREGNRVCVTARTQSDLESLESEVSALGGEAVSLCADMTVPEDIRRLREVVGKPVLLWDERLSTFEAEQALMEGGVRRDRRKDVVDMLAAQIILRSYLEAGAPASGEEP